MARTTANAVKEVLAPGKDYDERRQPSLTPFIDAASVLVTRVGQCSQDEDTPYSDAELELMERWLAAHAYKLSDQQYQSKNTAGAGASFRGMSGDGLKATLYGQMVLQLDWHGCLGQEWASSDWLGKPHSERIPYRDRN